jgi:rhomboid protease GluP
MMPSGPETEARRPRVIDAEMLDPGAGNGRVDFERGMKSAAPVTLTLIAVCCVVFAWQLAAGVLQSEAALVDGGALVADRIVRGEVWRLATSLFLHGDFDHLLGNMVALYILGIAVEHAFGSGRMAAIYLAAGLVGGLSSCAVNPLPTVGASGAIFGLMGCLVAVLLRIRHVVQVRDGRIGAVVLLWACYQLILGFTDPLIANFAHLGGFVAGFLLGLVVPSRTWPKLDVLPIS